MSYREIRNFVEIMRSLGYPRLISMENFRRPNFELVADILYWMVKLYDPETTISDRVEFENERVDFLTGIAALMATKARLKLNTKKLYASDGRAVQELLKLATLLYKATRSAMKSNDDEVIPPPIKVQDVKVARGLASEITQSGAKLYDLLANESTERTERVQALRFLDIAGAATEGSREYSFIERSAREIIDITKQTIEDVRKETEELETDERNLESKIRKKQEELERTEKRLRSLENVRPQFMDEVEKLEKELQYHYDIYVEKFRNMDYVEHELEKYHKAEEERKIEHDRRLEKMRQRLYKEEVDLIRGAKRDENDENDTKRILNVNRAGPPGGGGGGSSKTSAQQAARRLAKAQGSMTANSDEDSSEASAEGKDNRGGEDSDEEDLSVASKGRGPSNARRNRDGTLQSNRRSNVKDIDEYVDDDDDDGEGDDDDDMSDDDDDRASEGSDDQF